MLNFHSSAGKENVKINPAAAAIPPEVHWIDACRPEPHEIAFLERALGVAIPTLDKLSEIERSSRLYVEKDRLFLSTPMIFNGVEEIARTTPLGFVLSPDLLVTVRFKRIPACEEAQNFGPDDKRRPPSGPGALIVLLESLIDHIADELEKLTANLDRLSADIFGGEPAQRRDRKESHDLRYDLRYILRQIGRIGDHTSRVEDVLLGMSRMVPFVLSEADYLSGEMKAKFKSLQRDIASLNEYKTHQTNKVQFLLDATLGMTNIDQNNIFRVLTVVSVVGIPPTLVASMYGMNFKNMPELEWAYGYAWGLGLIAISALVPIVWFKLRGWW